MRPKKRNFIFYFFGPEGLGGKALLQKNVKIKKAEIKRYGSGAHLVHISSRRRRKDEVKAPLLGPAGHEKNDGGKCKQLFQLASRDKSKNYARYIRNRIKGVLTGASEKKLLALPRRASS